MYISSEINPVIKVIGFDDNSNIVVKSEEATTTVWKSGADNTSSGNLILDNSIVKSSEGVDDKLSIFGNSCIGSNTGSGITSRATFGHKDMSEENLAIYQLDSGKTILNSNADDGIDVTSKK